MSSYQDRKAEVLRLVEKIRAEESTDKEALRLVTKAVAGIPGGVELLTEVLKDVIRQDRTELGSAIAKAVFDPSDFHATLPAQVTTKATGPGDLGPAIVEAFSNRQSVKKNTRSNTIPSADGPRHGQLGGKKR